MRNLFATVADWSVTAWGKVKPVLVWVKDHPRTYAFVLGVAAGWWWL